MRVLIISQYFLPQPLANAEVVGALAFGLAERGHEVDVVAPVGSTRTRQGVHVHRAVGFFARNRTSKLARAAEYGSFSLGALVGGVRGPKPDVIVVPSPPPTLGLVGALVAALRRAPYLYVVQDLYPEVAASTGDVRSDVALRLLKAAMRLVYRRAAAVVVIDPYFVPVIERAESGAYVVAIGNAVDLEPFAGDDDLRSELAIDSDACVVMYAGNIGRSQDLAHVIDATRDEGATLVLHGGGAAVDQIRERVHNYGDEHVRFSSFRSRDALGAVYRTGDVHVVPLKPSIAAASVPSKLLSIFAARRPAIVVAEAGTPAARIIEESGAGVRVDPDDGDALRDAVRKAIADRSMLHEQGERGRAWLERHATAGAMAAAYESVLEEVARR